MAGEKKEISDIFIDNKISVIVLGVLVLVAVLGGGSYKVFRDKKEKEQLVKIFSFKDNNLKKYVSKELSDKQYVEGLDQLVGEVGSSKYLFPLYVESADALVKNRSLEKALDILDRASKTLSKNNMYMSYFISVRKATVLEDLNRVDEAINLLKSMNSSSMKLLPGKIYLDLGRLYLKKGDLKNAKINLKYVVDNYATDEFAKLAKALLAEMI